MNDQRLLTVREVAERVRSSPETVRRWIRSGRLRAVRPGGTRLGYRVPESEVQRFIALPTAPEDTRSSPGSGV
ncbi:MAG: helix-turn-helix domain-containing protein [Chloroflexi bacterium]|nr:helix-turn-helix domain-containing protein [Chloroflexota bacterium]MBV9597934.1 helix-turn-helix domain-containing protein [Chloroflexota bacterium]